MATAGSLIGPPDGWVVFFFFVFGIIGVILSPLVLLAHHCFVLRHESSESCNLTDAPKEADCNAKSVTPDRFVWSMIALCAAAGAGAVIVTGIWDHRLRSRYAVDYVEDTPERYLRIQIGSHGFVSITSDKHPRTEKWLCEVNGDVETLFEEMYRGHPQLVVESKRPVAYKIVYDPDDTEAPEIVARELGLSISTETREVDALVLRVGQTGCNLRRGSPPDNPDRFPDSRIPWDVGRPMEAISMDQLAEHLEEKHYHPVVNMTGLDGYWTVSRIDQALHAIPGRRNEKTPRSKPKTVRRLGNSGLELQWERAKLQVTVVSDIGP